MCSSPPPRTTNKTLTNMTGSDNEPAQTYLGKSLQDLCDMQDADKAEKAVKTVANVVAKARAEESVEAGRAVLTAATGNLTMLSPVKNAVTAKEKLFRKRKHVKRTEMVEDEEDEDSSVSTPSKSKQQKAMEPIMMGVCDNMLTVLLRTPPFIQSTIHSLRQSH
jgi:hypothetical protein